MDPRSPSVPPLPINPGYVLGQLARALTTSQRHDSPEVRERATRKHEDWQRVFQGLLSGHLDVGSRTPIAHVPAWATPRVVTGGFVTGELLAEGPLAPHERQWLEELGALSSPQPRAVLNAYFLGESGQEVLGQMLTTGAYRIDVPEEGALLVVTWLSRQGETERARELLDALAPFLGRLRFYPVPQAPSVQNGLQVRLQSAGETRAQLAAIRGRPELERQREALQLWHPLYDRLVQLFVETRTSEGVCRHFPEDWRERARRLRTEIVTARHEHPTFRWTHRPTSHFGKLVTALEHCLVSSEPLAAGQRRQVEHILEDISRTRGLPGSERARELRLGQERIARLPTSREFARVLVERLRARSDITGLSSLAEVAEPITEDEAARHHLPPGLAVPPALERKLKRGVEAPLEELVSTGMVGSSEVLARVLPQVSAHVHALGIQEPELRRLYGQLYAAFRRRRSLLLLNLQSQVRLQELPWMRVLDDQRTGSLAPREVARQTLEQVTTLALTAFPQSILPNKLLQELRALAQAAGMTSPIVEELAADIFMGTFTPKFQEAAAQAQALLEGTLYGRYYGLSQSGPWARDPDPTKRFAARCRERAREQGSTGGSVSANGMVIEQAQILTTHNLAPLFQELGLGQSLAPVLPELARRCYRWVLARLRMKTDGYVSRLRHLKNSAYAWRQMVFFLSLLPEAEQARFFDWAEATLREQRPELVTRFRPALERLRARWDGDPEATAGHLFLGWTQERHWLMTPRDAKDSQGSRSS